jgi:hypothetical protein
MKAAVSWCRAGMKAGSPPERSSASTTGAIAVDG